MGKAINAKGTLFSIGAGGADTDPETDTYTDLCNAASVGFSGETTDEIDTTTLCDDAKTFIAGFTDYGTVTVDGNYLPSSAGQKRLKELNISKSIANFRVRFPDDGEGNGEVFLYFKGTVLNVTPAAAVGAKITLNASIRVSGAITEVLPEVGG